MKNRENCVKIVIELKFCLVNNKIGASDRQVLGIVIKHTCM